MLKSNKLELGETFNMEEKIPESAFAGEPTDEGELLLCAEDILNEYAEAFEELAK